MQATHRIKGDVYNHYLSFLASRMASIINKDIALVVSIVLSVVSLVLLFGVTWYFQSSLDQLQQQVEYDRELLFKLQEQINVSS